MVATLTLNKQDTVLLDPYSIKTDGGTQSRAGYNSETLQDYIEAWERGDNFPPLEVIFDGSNYWLVDGFHRLESYKHTETEQAIACNVEQGTHRDAILRSLKANAKHGLRRTPADKRRAVITLLRDSEWSEWANTVIADKCGVDESLVRKVKEELSSDEPTIEQATKNGVDVDALQEAKERIASLPAQVKVQRGGTTYSQSTTKQKKGKKTNADLIDDLIEPDPTQSSDWHREEWKVDSEMFQVLDSNLWARWFPDEEKLIIFNDAKGNPESYIKTFKITKFEALKYPNPRIAAFYLSKLLKPETEGDRTDAEADTESPIPNPQSLTIRYRVFIYSMGSPEELYTASELELFGSDWAEESPVKILVGKFKGRYAKIIEVVGASQATLATQPPEVDPLGVAVLNVLGEFVRPGNPAGLEGKVYFPLRTPMESMPPLIGKFLRGEVTEAIAVINSEIVNCDRFRSATNFISAICFLREPTAIAIYFGSNHKQFCREFANFGAAGTWEKPE